MQQADTPAAAPPAPPPLTTLPNNNPSSTAGNTAGTTETGSRSPRPASHTGQHPRLYAPLFSLLNPIEDSSVGAAPLPPSQPPSVPTSLPGSVAHSAVSDARRCATAENVDASNAEGAPLLSTSPTADALPTDRHGNAAQPSVPAPSRRRRWWSACVQLAQEVRAASAREVLPVDQPRRLSPSEREKMARYESVDTYEPESMLYKDHLETRSYEPRWFMWVFVLLLGLGTSALSLVMAACLHVLNAMRYELLGFGLRSFSFVDTNRYPHSAGPRNTTSDPALFDVWATLKGRNVGLYGIDPPLAYGSGFLMWVVFAGCTSALASGVCYLVPESVGSGIPEVKAYLNGVAYPMMRSTRVLVAKIAAVVLTVGSGVCTGHYGHLMLAGAMLGAQLLQRRHGLRCYHVHFVDCFRNPRDRRVILVIGAAAGIASAFCVSVGGLLIILELLSAVLPVRFALYVFAACLLSTLCTQVYLSYWVNFDTRYRPGGGLQRGELLSEAVVLFRTHLPFGQHPAMNLMDFVAAFVIGLCCGLCAVVFVRVSWTALYLRRRMEVALHTKAIRYVLPIVFTLVYVSMHYAIAVAFTHAGLPLPVPDAHDSSASGGSPARVPAVCREVPYAVRSGRNVTTISFYGMNGFFCAAGATPDTPTIQDLLYSVRGDMMAGEVSALHDGASGGGELREEQSVRVVDAYASLAFSYADSTLQTLLSQRTAHLLPWRALGTFTVLYLISSAVYSGLALCGDTLLPSLVIGAALGRCVGTAVHAAALRFNADAVSWADPGVFALFGAGSFVSATTGLSFGVGAVLIESTADFRHLLPLMLAILVARRVLARWSRDALTMYLEARAVPLLNAEPYMARFPLLDAGHVLHSPVVALPVVCSLEDIVRVLHTTTHHGFPVVSAQDGTFKGIVSRAQLEVLLWHLILSHGRVAHCTYDVLQRVEDHVFHNHWEGSDPVNFLPEARLRSTQISLYPHVDTSAFTVLDTTALSVTYEMFTTLGLRHLVVVDRLNYAVGMITRKDLTGDHLSAMQGEQDGVMGSRDAEDAEHGAGTNARDAAFAALRAPLHPTPAQVADVTRNSSTRRLQQQLTEAEQRALFDGAAPLTSHQYPHPQPPLPSSFAQQGEELYYTQALRRISLLQRPSTRAV